MKGGGGVCVFTVVCLSCGSSNASHAVFCGIADSSNFIPT